MITVKLWGGMCNQMFQYAFGYALAKKHGDKLCFDVDFYENQPGHVGKRGVMGKELFPALKDMEFVKRSILIKLIENKYFLHLVRYRNGLRLRLPWLHAVVEKLHKHYEPVPYIKGVNNYYDGYWQTDAYFKEYKDEIRAIFTPSQDILDKVRQWRNSIQNPCCVAVHIRRGDYLQKVNQGKINTTDDNLYYLAAFKKAKGLLNNPMFCFFSDDIEWCKQTYGGLLKDVEFVENKSKDGALLDLFSIAECEHGIMSPSTFSYWGNWLRNPKKHGVVIYPEGDYYDDFITNKEWIEIKSN